MQQQLEKTTTATSDALGNALFVFEDVPPGLTWWGSVQITAAPFAALHSAEVNGAGTPGAGTDWGSWSGPLAYGAVQCNERQNLQIISQQLAPLTRYSCVWLGISDDDPNPTPQFPTAISIPQAFGTTPFVANVMSGAGPQQLGPFPCSNVRGCRAALINLGTAPANFYLQWNSAPPPGLAPLLLGQRHLIVPAQGQASFTVPHLGDTLTVIAQTIGVPALNLNVVLSHVDSDREVWSNIDGSTPGGTIGDALFFVPMQSIAATTTIQQLCPDLYAGAATFYAASGATNWTVTLEAMDSVGTFNRLAMFSQASTAFDGVRPITIPPAPLRLSITNSDAAAKNMGSTLIADSWRG